MNLSKFAFHYFRFLLLCIFLKNIFDNNQKAFLIVVENSAETTGQKHVCFICVFIDFYVCACAWIIATQQNTTFLSAWHAIPGLCCGVGILLCGCLMIFLQHTNFFLLSNPFYLSLKQC